MDIRHPDCGFRRVLWILALRKYGQKRKTGGPIEGAKKHMLGFGLVFNLYELNNWVYHS